MTKFSFLQKRDFLGKREFWVWALFITAFVGMLVAGYLWYEYSQPQAIGCSVTGGCEKVRVSDFSNFLGVSLPIWGLVYYLGLLVLIISKFIPRPRFRFENVVFVLYTFSGFLFSLYLTYLELFVIHAICQWCMISAICSTLAFFMSLRLSQLEKRT